MNKSQSQIWAKFQSATFLTQQRSQGIKRPRSGTKLLNRKELPLLNTSASFDYKVRPITALSTSSLLNKSVSLTQINKVYNAKCNDLKIPVLQQQKENFINLVERRLKNRRFALQEAGLGQDSGTVIGSILAECDDFYKVELGRNNLQDKGAISIAKGLKCNLNLVHLGLGSNNITSDGIQSICKILILHDSLISLDLSSYEGLNRNRIGSKGAKAIGNLVKQSEILQFLNIGGTGLGGEGIQKFLHKIRNNKILIYLNISNNNISSSYADFIFSAVYSTQIQELDVSQNKLQNEGAYALADILQGFRQPVENILKLNLSNNELTNKGSGAIFNSLRNHQALTHLILDSNHLVNNTSCYQCLIQNQQIQQLSFKNCELALEGVQIFSEGLAKNSSLEVLILSQNLINDNGVKALANGLMHNSSLKQLDLSGNKVNNEGAAALADMLKKNSTLLILELKDNHIHDEGGRLLVEITRINRQIQKLTIDFNPMNFRYVVEMKQNMHQNKIWRQQRFEPLLKQRIKSLQVKENAFERIKDKTKAMKLRLVKEQEYLVKDKERLQRIVENQEQKFQSLLKYGKLISQKVYEANAQFENIQKDIIFQKFLMDQQIRTKEQQIKDVEQSIHNIEANSYDVLKKQRKKRKRLQDYISRLQKKLQEDEYMKKLMEDRLMSTQKRFEALKLKQVQLKKQNSKKKKKIKKKKNTS